MMCLLLKCLCDGYVPIIVTDPSTQASTVFGLHHTTLVEADLDKLVPAV